MSDFEDDTPLPNVLFDRPKRALRDEQEVEFYDPESKTALTSLLPPRVAEAVSLLPIELLVQDEKSLELLCDATEVERMVHISFWNEYLLALDNKRTMSMDRVYHGNCSREYFYKHILRRPEKLAYVVCPRKDYMLSMEELLDLARDQMRLILGMSNEAGNGQPNTKLISEKVKIFQMIENRVKGSIVNRHQIASRSENINKNEIAPASTDTFEMQMARIEAELAALKGLPPPVTTEGLIDGREKRVFETPATSAEADGVRTRAAEGDE